MRRKKKMLKEMVHKIDPKNEEEKLSPVEEALLEFKKDNGYDFLDMINNPKTRHKHKLKQLQKKNYDDDDFLEKFQDFQGE